MFVKQCRVLSQNAQYIICTRQIRDKTVMVNLGRQFLPKHPGFLSTALEQATKEGIGSFLLIDCHIKTE